MQHLAEILVKSSNCFSENIALEEPRLGNITYKALSQKTSEVQSTLSNYGISEGKVVGILQPKNIESVISILGVLSAKAAYVPVDFNAPMSRNSYIFHDCKVDALLINEDQIDNFLFVYSNKCSVYDLEGFSIKLVIPNYIEKSNNEERFLPENLAYILYTSGSTGNPKGVMISHSAALSFIEWSYNTFKLSNNDTITSIAPFHFDLSIFDIYVSLLSGSKLILINQKAGKNPRLISELIEKHRINLIYATPTFLRLILQYGKPSRFDHSSLRSVLFAGEVFPIEPLRKLKDLWRNVQFYNLYGPTETNVVTWFKVPNQIPDGMNSPFPIGLACSFANCKLWNGVIEEPIEGAKGELIVSGVNLADGYLNLPEKTKTNFFVEEKTRWYRTGDLVTVNDNLEFVFLGRQDRMIKRNGYRIELAEIESALSSHPDIGENGVIAISNNGEIIIKACIQLQSQETVLTTVELKQFCQSKLLGYMLPDKFVFLEELPKTSTHKIDYQKLKQL